MCNRSKLLVMHLLQSWAMDLWSPGVKADDGGRQQRRTGAAARMCSRFKLLAQAFTAILSDGSVVTWGDADCGGDSSDGPGASKERATHPSFWFCICCNLG